MSLLFLKKPREVVLGAHDLGVGKARILKCKYHEDRISAHVFYSASIPGGR